MYVIYTVNMFIGFTGIDDAKDMYRSMVYTSFTSQMHLISLMVYKLKYLYVQGQCETSWVNLRSSCKLSTFTNIIHLESKLLLHGAAPSAEQGSCDISDGPETTEYFIYTFKYIYMYIFIFISYTNPQKKTVPGKWKMQLRQVATQKNLTFFQYHAVLWHTSENPCVHPVHKEI